MQSASQQFDQNSYYLLPRHWLTNLTNPGDLDTRDLLLAHLVDGLIIFPDTPNEQSWYRPDPMTRLPELFTRQTYSRYKNALIDAGLLHHYVRQAKSTTRAQQELERGIRYTIPDWPWHTDLLRRHHSYLHCRWPAWLGTSDLGSRLVLLAAMALHNDASEAPVTWHAIVSWLAKLGFAEEEIKLDKGIRELQVLGLANESEGSPLAYHFHFNQLNHEPTWPPAMIAATCGLHPIQDHTLLTLIRTFMHHCREPVTRLRRVHHALKQLTASPYLLDEVDQTELTKQVQIQRKDQPFLPHDRVIGDYIRKVQGQGERQQSTRFTLPVREIALIRYDQAGERLRMPTPSAHGLQTTQLWLCCRRPNELSIGEVQTIFAHLYLFLWQERTEEPPLLLPIPIHVPKSRGVDLGYCLRANHLHRQLAYDQPFEFIIKCDRPDDRLVIEGSFRLLWEKGRVKRR